jgi:hypothetical protein
MRFGLSLKLFSAAIVLAASVLPGLASAKTWGTVDGFAPSYTWLNIQPTAQTNYYILRGTGASQNPTCQYASDSTKAFYQASVAVQLHQISFAASPNLNYLYGCDINNWSYYGDLEYQLDLIDIRSGQEVLMSRTTGVYRLDMSSSAGKPSVAIAFPDSMQPGRYRARAWTRVPGRDDWRHGTVDFNAKTVPIGMVEIYTDRCRNPLRPSCGIQPRYHVEGWACDPIAISGTFTPSKLTLDEYVKGSGFASPVRRVPFQNFRVLSRPDIVSAGYCSNTAVGFSYDHDGDTYYYHYVMLYNGQPMQGKTFPY